MSTVYTITYHNLSTASWAHTMSPDHMVEPGRYNWHMAPEINITDWCKGSQWFEEHYFPTMLTIQSPSHLANRSLTYVDWSRGGPHPATFGKRDISASFLRKIALSKTCTYNGESISFCFLFARKFAPSALETLLELASEVLGFLL
ncbi:hypothetical protein QQ045_023751 [Rhodiola kirilowii]